MSEWMETSTRMRRSTKHARLVLALAPNEVPMELCGRVELLGEDAGLALLGLGVLFGRGQVEDQIGDDEALRRLVEPGDILLAEAGEVDSVDLFSREHRNQKHGY
jgi:hypothetical protein